MATGTLQRTPYDNDSDTDGSEDPRNGDSPQPGGKAETEKSRRLSGLQRAALHGGIYAAGKIAKKKSGLSPGEIENLERLAHGAADRDLYGDEAKQLGKNLRDPSWYKKNAKKTAVKKLFGRHKKMLIGTLMVNLVVGLALLIFGFIGPLKNTHFDTVMRTANFLRFQHVLQKQFSRAAFEAAVLSKSSVGSYQRTLMVRQLQLVVPPKQMKQLGRDHSVKWEFTDNRGFGQNVLPVRETFRALIIDGQRFDLDEYAREQFGRDYADLKISQKWAVEARFVNTVSPLLSEKMALTFRGRFVRFSPSFQLRKLVGVTLNRWKDKASAYADLDEDESRALHIQETVEQVGGPEDSRIKPGSSELSQGAEDYREGVITAAVQKKKTPIAGEIANSLKKRVKFISRAGDAATWTTIGCIMYELAVYFDSAEGQRLAQAARFAITSATSVDQAAAGGVDYAQAIGQANADWDGVPGGPEDASKSQIYKQITGQPVDTTTAAYKNELNEVPLASYSHMFESFNSAVAKAGGNIGLGGFCGFMMSAGAQWTITGAELLLAGLTLGSIKGVTAGVRVVGEIGFHAAVGYGVGELMDWLIGLAIRSYANTDFLVEMGVKRVGALHTSYMTVAQHANRTTTMGAPVTPEQSAAATQEAITAYRLQNEQSSFSNRYFAIDNPYSLLGRVVAAMPSSLGGASDSARSVASFIGTVLTSPFRLVGSIGSAFTARTHAADTSFLKETFGVEQWGWTVEELKRIDTDPSFSLGPLLQYVEPRLHELDQRYGKCYDETTFILQSQKPEECTQKFLSGGHPDYGDDALYWRYYKAMFFAAQRLTGPV